MKNVKTTMLEYVDWRGDLEFTRDSLNEVDCLIYSSLAYIDYDTAPYAHTSNIKSAPTLEMAYKYVKDVKCFGSMFMDLCHKCAQSVRFKDTKVMFYQSVMCEEEQTQFSAVTFVLSSGEAVVAFRGTDDTLVGWQEDFNMALGVVPAHKYARRYINDIAMFLPESKIYIAGHSKGGNLAVWAASHLYDEHFNRLVKVYDFDGPGFSGDFIYTDEYKRIIDKTTKYVVDASIVGMLLSSTTPQLVVESKSHNTMLQHMTQSWLVVGRNLCTLKSRSSRGINSQVIIEELVDSLDFDERKQLTVMIGEFVKSTGLKAFSDIKSIDAVIKLFNAIKSGAQSEEDKQLMQTVGQRLATIIKNRALGAIDIFSGD